MTRRIFLHPGPVKTGTTYLQSLLYANRGPFLAQGITIIGDQGAHFRAAAELMRRQSLRMSTIPEGAVANMRAAVLRAPGDVVMSCERYSLFGADHVRRMLEELAGREMHVVLTLRDLTAVVPARWQEGVKNGGTTTWTEFQEQIADGPAWLRKMTRARNTLDAWGPAVPPERIHVVTVPPPGASRTLLFERFCEAAGVDPSRMETFEASRDNPSMDLVSTELIRRINAQDDTELSGHVQHSEIKVFLARKLAEQSRGRPELSAAAFRAARLESQALVEQIRASGFHVVGDLEDLTSTPSPAATDAGVDVDAEELLDAAAIALAALAERSGTRGLRLRECEEERRRGGAAGWWRRVRRRLPG